MSTARTPEEHTRQSQAWQDQRRARGLCTKCGQRPTEVNPRTGFHKWLCPVCQARQTDRQRQR